MVGPTQKPLQCEVWLVTTGRELRLVRAGEVFRTQLARGPAAEEEIAELAAEWQRVLEANGFTTTY